VNDSSIAVSVEAPTPERRQHPWVKSRSAAATSRCTGGVLSRGDRTGLIELLAARYPVTRRLAGELSFRIVARRFILADPPGTPIPESFYDYFPCFIRSLGNIACIEYVADVADLERLRHKAQYAQPVRPLALALSSPRAERLNGLRLVLHPSVYLVQSRFPIVTAWENNQTDDRDGMIERWVAEAAMVARPFLKVEVRCLPSGGYAFLGALSGGKTVATAAQIATEVSSEFDVASSLRLIEDAKVVVGIQEAQ
jgi:Putative DNA-binding domain